jgi:PD-(D/E)XK nuclease superfamily domain
MSRDTRTGSVLEQMVLPALERGGYDYQTQVNIGTRLGGRKHVVDIVAKDRQGLTCLISLKWQQVGGTAEQKVPFEAMCLTDAVLTSNDEYNKAYLVLGGEGWKLRDFFVNGGLAKYLRYDKLVTIMTLESFVAKANKSQL